MKAPVSSLFRVFSPLHARFRKLVEVVSYRALVIIGLSLTIVVTALMFDLASDAQERPQSRSSISEDNKTSISPKSDTEKGSRMPENYDIRMMNTEAAKRVIEKSAPGLQKKDITAKAVQQGRAIAGGLARLKKEAPKAEVDISPLTAAVEIVRSPSGLTGPDHRKDGSAIVRDFLSENMALYGLDSGDIGELNFIGESVSPASGLRMVRVEQMVNGRPIFQSESRFILGPDGRIGKSLGSMIPNAGEAAPSLDGVLSPGEALRLTMEPMGVQLDPGLMKTTPSKRDGFSAQIKANDPSIGGDVTSKLVYFPMAPGVLVAAYSQTVFGTNEDWYVLVDARDGTLLWRKNIRSHASTQDARFRVYVQADGTTPADSPAPQSPSNALPSAGTQFPGITPSIVSMFLAQNVAASPNGWINDCPGGVCTANETQTIGNNAVVCMDRTVGNVTTTNVCDTDANSMLDGNGRPMGNPDANTRNRDFLGVAPRDFETGFLPPPQGGNPEVGQHATGTGLAFDQFRRGSVVQQFYNTNWYHDKLHALGFNQAAGNFQNDNFGGGGLGNDRVLVDVQDGAGTNNANFSTPPDGNSGRSQMFRFTGPTIDRDGGLDAEILFHELTHGTSNRLIGNAAGLFWDIGSGMGEGWSDFYALALLNNANTDDPNGSYASGAYATYKLGGLLDNYVYGIRRFPFSTNNSVNPLTWADLDQTTYNHSGGLPISPLGFEFNGALEVHNSGEIWTLTLWEVRSRIIAANGGNVPVGNQIALQLVTDGMKETPDNPSFIQARDALFDADCGPGPNPVCPNEDSIWNGFADRGLGYGARVPNSTVYTITGNPATSFSGHIGVAESFQAPDLDVNTVVVNDSIGNNTASVDPNEPVLVQINLKNPWRGSSKTATGVSATLTTSTPGVVIESGSTTYPNIGPNSNAIASGAALRVRAPSAAACGSRLNFTLTVTSSLGTVARDFSIRVGLPSGTDTPVTYTRGGLGITIDDAENIGKTDSMTITDDLEIADLDLRMDNITHTFPGDLTFGIRGPNGYGTNTMYLLGGTGGGGGDDNMVNTVFDDESTNEVLAEVPGAGPYTKSYRPVWNSPVWDTVTGFPPAEPSPPGQLSNFDGLSTQGVWTARVSDQYAEDTGTWQGWSLIITPRAFTCTPFVPASVSVSGRVLTAQGRGLASITVTMTDASGNRRSTLTNPFGFYGFTDVSAPGTYTLAVISRRFQFDPQVISVTGDVTGVNFTAQAP